MAEYGRVVGQSSGAGGGGGGGGDIGGDIMNAITDAFEQVAALPPEMLIGGAIVTVIGLVFLRR